MVGITFYDAENALHTHTLRLPAQSGRVGLGLDPGPNIGIKANFFFKLGKICGTRSRFSQTNWSGESRLLTLLYPKFIKVCSPYLATVYWPNGREVLSQLFSEWGINNLPTTPYISGGILKEK